MRSIDGLLQNTGIRGRLTFDEHDHPSHRRVLKVVYAGNITGL